MQREKFGNASCFDSSIGLKTGNIILNIKSIDVMQFYDLNSESGRLRVIDAIDPE